MKKLLFVFPIVILLAAGCNSHQIISKSAPEAQAPQSQQAPQPVAQPNLRILYPAGGEKFNLDSSITIRYSISPNFAKQLTEQNNLLLYSSELYLLDSSGTVEGFIGIVDPTQQSYSWKTNLDENGRIPQVGDYKILLVSRPKLRGATSGGGYPPDMFINGITNFDGTRIALTDGSQPSYADVLAYAVSNIFSLEGPAVADASNWKIYTASGSNTIMTFNYPPTFFVASPSGMDPDGTNVGVNDFPSGNENYDFPYIMYPEETHFFMRIEDANLDGQALEDWINKTNVNYPTNVPSSTGNCGGPECVSLEATDGVDTSSIEDTPIGSFGETLGSLISERQLTINNQPALQRVVSYQAKKVNEKVEVVYTYFVHNGEEYQFIAISTTPENLAIYNQILSTVAFK
jgi:hypothetical protein